MATLPQAQLAYLALGDSYSIGEGVAEQGRWPMQLALGLREAGIAIADPRIIATTGWTTDELSAAMDAAEPLGEWDFVSLLIGVNNQYRGRDVERSSNALDAYTGAAREACAAHGVAFVDIADVSRTRGAEPAMLAEDGLHPSALMYAEWTRLALPVAKGLLDGDGGISA